MEKTNTQVQVQKFGRFLSGMVMPNIGAFIAWGLITALFIPTGWAPNEQLATLVGPMITYLLPMLIGYTGGKMIGGIRGGVMGAIATFGVIIGTAIPMFIGGMIMGPIGGWVITKFDEAVEDKIPTGFEMLVNNFSAGIIGTILALLAYLGVGPAVEALSNALGNGVGAIVNANLLPVASVFIEPAKILFLNNAINHGVLSPLGIEQAAEAGKSIFFLLEANPGPGLGVLCAYAVFAKGTAKQSAPGAIIIHFLGGIHEIYFPYILMQPILLLAVIAGGASGVLTFSIFGAGLVAPASPGSIFAVMAMAPKGGLIPVLLGVIVAAVVSFLVAAIFIRKTEEDSEEFEQAQEKMVELKGKKSSVVETRDSKEEAVEETSSEESKVLLRENIKLGLGSVSKEEAIRTAGRILVDSGFVDENYIEAMIERENQLTTYIGNGTAIPHGVGEAKKSIKKTGICVLQYPEGVDFGGEKAYIIVGIAGAGDEHLMILAKLAEIVEEESQVEALRTTKDIEFVYNKFLEQ